MLGELDMLGHLTSLIIYNERTNVRTLLATLRSAINLTHARDPETGSHLERMSRYSRLIAQALAEPNGLDDSFVEHVYLFAPLHDLGKIGCMSDARWRELAAQMGYDDACFADDDEMLARSAFNDAVPFDRLRDRGWIKLPIADAPFADGGFPTPDGRCRVSSAEHGVPDHVPNHESADSTPELARRYPLAMISPPARNFLNSSFVNVKSLRDIEGEPLVEMHADDAASLGIAAGDMVEVQFQEGSIEAGFIVGRFYNDKDRPLTMMAPSYHFLPMCVCHSSI